MGGTTAATEVACVTREVAVYGANLSGPARAMSLRANAEMDRAADRDHRDEGVALVTPGDVYANRAVAIPEPVRAGLVDTTDVLVQTASNAVSAAACLDRATQDRPSGSGPEPAPPRSRPRDAYAGGSGRTPCSLP